MQLWSDTKRQKSTAHQLSLYIQADLCQNSGKDPRQHGICLPEELRADRLVQPLHLKGGRVRRAHLLEKAVP